jgi:anti-sigma B factor antagonist
VALSGEIDIVAVPEVRRALADATSRATAGVIADLGEVSFLDAAGLGVLAGAAHRTRHLPGGLRLVAVPRHAVRLLKLTGLDHHLAVFGSPPDRQRLPGQVGVALDHPHATSRRSVGARRHP